MAADRSFLRNTELQRLQGDAIIDLWELDLQAAIPTIDANDRYLRFCNWTTTGGASVTFATRTYEPIPYQVTGLEIKHDGTPPNPAMIVSNLGTVFNEYITKWDDLVGVKATRRRVLRKNLDDGSSPDATAHWPDEIWFVQQKESENKLSVTFRLATAFDLDGVLLPNRKALKYQCIWEYRGDGCAYTGDPVADAFDRDVVVSDTQPVGAAVEVEGRIWVQNSTRKIFIYDTSITSGSKWREIPDDICSKSLWGCRKRFPGNQDAPFGGFPGLTNT